MILDVDKLDNEVQFGYSDSLYVNCRYKQSFSLHPSLFNTFPSRAGDVDLLRVLIGEHTRC